MLKIGEVVAGRWKVLALIGEGGMGAVYRVLDLDTERERALKVMHARLHLDAAMRAAFDREVKVGGKVKCHAIVEVFACGVDERVGPWIAMELLQGETLEERTNRRGQLPREQAHQFVEDLLRALGAAHEVGVVHMDLKPKNLFLHDAHDGRPPTLKVIDFGIARLLPAGDRSGTASKAVGSLAWMSPAQYDSRIRPENDVWSIGLIVFYVLTGKTFWRNTEGMALLTEAFFSPLLLASERAAQLGLAESLPAGFDVWFARAVCREPDLGFRDTREAAPPLLALLRGEALDAVAPTQLSPTLVAPPPAPRPAVAPAARPPTRRRSWSLRALLGAALTAAAAVALTLGRGCGAAAVRHDMPPPPPRDAAVVAEDAATPAIVCPAGMVPMRGGAFDMGDDDPALGNPRRRVTLSPYCLDETEGTVGAFRAFWTDGHRAPTGALRYPAVALSWAGSVTEPLTRSPENGCCTWTRTAGNANAEALPLTCVDWHTMLAWCASRGARLPTEAEWEFAARGTDRRRYPWGDADPTRELLNACGDECQEAHLGWRAMAGFGRDLWAEVAPVGLFPATRPPGAVAANYRGGGLRDLAGNVWEWTADAASTAGVPSPSGDERDPLVIAGDGRVSKGGGWDDSAAVWVRAAARSVTAPGHRYDNRGGRCASAPVR